MSFATIAERAVRDAFERLGQPATYSPAGGDPVETVVAVIPRVEEYPAPGDRRLAAGPKDDLMVKLADVANPRRGDQVVVDGKTYHVDGELPADRSAFATRLQVHAV